MILCRRGCAGRVTCMAVQRSSPLGELMIPSSKVCVREKDVVVSLRRVRHLSYASNRRQACISSAERNFWAGERERRTRKDSRTDGQIEPRVTLCSTVACVMRKRYSGFAKTRTKTSFTPSRHWQVMPALPLEGSSACLSVSVHPGQRWR